jgi:hypothetical protein
MHCIISNKSSEKHDAANQYSHTRRSEAPCMAVVNQDTISKPVQTDQCSNQINDIDCMLVFASDKPVASSSGAALLSDSIDR